MRGKGEAVTVMIRLSSLAFDLACSSLSHLYLEGGIDKDVMSKDL